MNGMALLLAVASLNVVYSWRTGIDQQQEYVLQIEPEIVQALAAGEEIYSDIPADAGPFQRLCIFVLAKDGSPTRHTAAGEEQFRQLVAAAGRYASRDRTLIAPDLPPTLLWPGRSAGPEQTYGVTTGWQPDKNGSQQYLVQIDPTVLSTLALGDELYVPVDPAAGRLVRFVVKAGRGNLPKLGGAQATSRYDSAVNRPPTTNNNRFGGLNDNSAGWDSTRYSDTARQPAGGYASTADQAYPHPSTTQPRSLSGIAPGAAGQYGPAATFGAPPLTPPPGYATSAQVPPVAAYPDQYRGAASAPQAPPGYTVQPVASQQPQLPATSPQFQPQYPEARVAALPPPATAVTGGGPLTSTTTAGASRPQEDKPWGPLLFVTFALFFSIGGNLYLAYTALEFHSRYRSAIERLRAAARSS